MLSYSIGMAILGSLLHRISLKTYVTTGLFLASLVFMVFPLLWTLSHWYSPVVLVVCMCLNGFFQATGWPGVVGIMGYWFEKHRKGVLMALWSRCGTIGNILTLNLCNLMADHGVNWTWNFFMTGLFTIFCGLLSLFILKEKPEPKEEEPQNKSLLSEDQQDTSEVTAQPYPRPTVFKYGIFSVLALPRVPYYVIGYAFLKGGVYGLLFWLPTFLSDKGGSIKDQKGYISAMKDIGSLSAAVLIGHLSDSLGRKRGLFLMPFLVACAGVMFVVAFVLTSSPWQYYIAMFFIGITQGPPYDLMASLMVLDIGQQIK